MALGKWQEYVRRVTGTLTHAQISEKSGVAQSNVGRWLRGEHIVPKADSVISFAQSFGQPPVEALIAAGYLEESQTTAPRSPLSMYSTGELFAELARRNPAD